MADSTISSLTEVTSPNTSDVLPIVNAGATKKVTVNNLNLVKSVNGATGTVVLDNTDVGAAPTVHTHVAGSSGNIQYNSGTDFAGENDLNWDTANKSLKVGQPTLLANNPLAVKASVAGYAQINMQNVDAGTSSSGDIVVTSDNGTDTDHYIDMGINSSTYDNVDFSITGAGDAYLYTANDNLAIGTGGAGKQVVFHTGGTTSTDERLRITDAGLELPTSSTILVGGVDVVYHNHQSGIEGEPTITEGTGGDAGKFSVASATAWFYTDATREELVFKNISASGFVTPTAEDTTIYVCADRDTSAWVQITTQSTIDYNRYVPYFIVFKRTGSNNLHHQVIEITAHGEVENNHDRLLSCYRYTREQGALESINVDTSLNITMSGGGVWVTNHRYQILDVTTATRQFEMLNTTGTWSVSPSSHTTPVINNTQYNGASGYTTLTDTYWNITYIYRGIEDQDHLYTILSSQEYATSALAQADNTVPAAPELITSHAMFVGRVIAQKGATTGFIKESAFTTVFAAASAVTDHGSLAGLGDDDHTQYAKKVESVDIEITDSTKGIILKSNNGTRFRVTISDNGELTTTAL